VKQSTKVVGGTALRRPLAILAAAGLVVTGCANNPAGAPSSPPAVASTLPAEPQTAAVIDWTKLMCQALDPAFDLGTAPQPDFGNPAATRQAYIDYLSNARNVAQQAIDRFSSLGPAPVANGQQVFDNMHNQLVQLRKDLDDALARLNQADPNDAAQVGLALGAAASNILGALGNRLQVFGSFVTDPQLRTAVEQTPECQNLMFGSEPTTGGS
jgi:hypothetical protein